ncbi:MAG: leuA 1 [Firmicutes bacterium]|nr:leuA 1 [Bacillota bacterium]
MKEEFMFIDQTLGYALETQSLDIAEFIAIKRKIATMSPVIFDLTLQSFLAVLRYAAVRAEDIRIGIQPTAKEVAAAHQLGCCNIKVSLDDNAIHEMPALTGEALRQAREWEMNVALHIIGNCEYPASKVRHICRIVKEYGITSIVFDDSKSELDSVATYWRLLDLQQEIPCGVEYYGSNGKGLATGNALGAIKSGVRHIAVAVGGVGGYPAFEEVLMSARYLLKFPLDIPGNMAECCGEILSYAGQTVNFTKPIIGAHIFAHESGIHVDGVNKRSDLYEPFTPETVGLSRKIIIGKHSGKAAIEFKIKEMNISLQPTAVSEVLEKVRGLAIRQKAPVSDRQLQSLAHEAAS